MADVVIFKNMLSGKDAFYNQPDYLKNTKADFSSKKALPATYNADTESKVIRIAKDILSVIIFPIGIYILLQSLAGKVGVLPSSSPYVLHLFGGRPLDYTQQVRENTLLTDKWKFKRMTVEVDGYKVDATIMGTEETLDNGRWFLGTGGNAEFAEENIQRDDYKNLLQQTKSNAIFFNYPGVSSSSGLANRSSMAKAYKAMLKFLEDQEKGIAAKEIILYGHSIGAGAQAEALKNHEFNKDIKYVAVKSRTFTSLYDAAKDLTGLFLAIFVKILRWNMDVVEASIDLPIPEIIMQKAKGRNYVEVTDSSQILHDGIISEQAALAKALLDKKIAYKNKFFMGIPDSHNVGLYDPTFLAEKIEELLSHSWQ